MPVLERNTFKTWAISSSRESFPRTRRCGGAFDGFALPLRNHNSSPLNFLKSCQVPSLEISSGWVKILNHSTLLPVLPFWRERIHLNVTDPFYLVRFQERRLRKRCLTQPLLFEIPLITIVVKPGSV